MGEGERACAGYGTLTPTSRRPTTAGHRHGDSVRGPKGEERGKREGRCAGVCEISFWNGTFGVIDSYSPEDGEGRQVWTES